MLLGYKETRDVVFVAPAADVSIVAHVADRITGQRRSERTASKTAVDQPSVGHKRSGDRLGNGVLSQSGRNIPERVLDVPANGGKQRQEFEITVLPVKGWSAGSVRQQAFLLKKE
jgi:hypothetical protein